FTKRKKDCPQKKCSLRAALTEDTDNVKSTVFTLSYAFFTKRKKDCPQKKCSLRAALTEDTDNAKSTGLALSYAFFTKRKSARFAILLRRILLNRSGVNHS
ncbi:hypothetical protein, partial [uncultured Negativibacillus sp.]|uniref:hypothetical protein n=1 Tax=uncultured Negativibacillus sp. TaxID=1980696 RepID=UPI0025D19C58